MTIPRCRCGHTLSEHTELVGDRYVVDACQHVRYDHTACDCMMYEAPDRLASQGKAGVS